MIDLLLARADLTMLARPSVDYLASHGILWSDIIAATSGVFVAPIRLVPPNHFDLDPDGQIAAVCEVLGEDGETVIDLVAWSLTDPHKTRVMFGRAPALGMAAAVNPATYFGDRPLHVFRSPLTWLRARCGGAVLLDPDWGARWLIDVPTSIIAAEDDTHAREIARSRKGLIEHQAIVVPARHDRVKEAA